MQPFLYDIKKFGHETNKLSVGVLVLDINGFVIYSNPSAKKIVGFDISFDKPIFHQIKIPEIKEFSLKSNVPQVVGETVVSKDGEQTHIKFFLSPLLDSQSQSGAILELIDVTELCERLDEKNKFIGVLAHELKTPLTSLFLGCEMLHRTKDISDKKTIENQISLVREQIHSLKDLINSLFDFSQINSNQIYLSRKKIEFCNVFEKVVRLMNIKDSKLLTIKSCGPIYGYWDETKMEQVIRNLMSNAIKYGKNNPIAVTIDKKENFLVFKVTDSGIGIPESKLLEVFKEHKRQTKIAKKNSLGLGLYIVKKIVEAHGGTVTVDSKENVGTTFTVNLLLNTEHENVVRSHFLN